MKPLTSRVPLFFSSSSFDSIKKKKKLLTLNLKRKRIDKTITDELNGRIYDIIFKLNGSVYFFRLVTIYFFSFYIDDTPKISFYEFHVPLSLFIHISYTYIPIVEVENNSSTPYNKTSYILLRVRRE